MNNNYSSRRRSLGFDGSGTEEYRDWRLRGWVKGLGLAYGEKSTEVKPNNKIPLDHLIPKMRQMHIEV